MDSLTCIAVEDEPRAKSYLEDCIDKTDFLKRRGSFDHAVKAWDFLKTNSVDLVISDIAMPDISGISFLKNLKNPPLFIFVTANLEYAAESFDLDVVDYIVKPFEYARFLKAVTKAQAVLYNGTPLKSQQDFLTIKDGHKNVVIRFKDILYVKGDKEYVTIVTSEQKHMARNTLIHMEEILPSRNFVRAQKSYIVNMDLVRELTASTIVLKGSQGELPIGAQYREELFRRFGIG